MDPSNPTPTPSTSPSPSPSSMRVLIRLPPASSSPFPAPLPPTDTPPPSSSQPRLPEGVVVVGFVSQRPELSARLLNNVLDSNVFGSGALDKTLCLLDKEGVRDGDWFKSRRISYYHQPEKGILFLQFCSTCCPSMGGLPEAETNFDSALEERDVGDLQGMLFMFSVCHVIIYIQEGSRIDIHSLKEFRVLQAAKQALVPFVRSRTMPPLPTRPRSSSRGSTSTTSSNNPSPGRSGGTLSRNASAISLMSGLGSNTSLFPGLCTPVMLFVFVDDFSDWLNPSPNVDESKDNSSFNQSSSVISLARPSVPVKGSGSIMVLARPVNKSEGGFRKKLQSSLEAQIRFLIKKCRTLSGSETSHPGSRSGVASSSVPLFSFDASRAVVLLDLSSQRCESLEFSTGLVEDILNGKGTSDSLLLDSHGQGAIKDDILSVKEFIYKQSDILRGRGGLVNNTNSGSATGGGMVAVAAAAAAASAASGKTHATPELPSLEIWLSSSQLILQGVLSGKGGCIDEAEIGKRKPRLRNTAASQQLEGSSLKNMNPPDVAVSWLECGRGLNVKFSTLWCERVLPAAKEVYLSNLPSCYPTSLHETHLEKALHAFHSMVKGPAVQHFTKKLEDECTNIWKSGRQLCDAVSLTGKPCMHQRHDVQTDQSDREGGKAHSSGYAFLRACACGRSRQLQADPFDFESANITSNCFPDCDRLLPALQLPEVSNSGPIKQSSWSLIRVGAARYYEPSKGLLQSGFSATQRFLLQWTIYLDVHKSQNDLLKSDAQPGSLTTSSTKLKFESNADMDIKKTGIVQLYSGDLQTGSEHQGTPSEKFYENKISFGKGLPNFTLRKPFSAVVAGSTAIDTGFPPLQQSKQSSSISDKEKQNREGNQGVEQAHAFDDAQGSQKSDSTLSVEQNVNGVNNNGYSDGDPFLRIGKNVVPVNVNGGEEVKMSSSLKHVIVYVGFEHECPHGHRFLLNPEHLNELGYSYSLFEESHASSSPETSNHKMTYMSNLRKNGGHGKVHRKSDVMNASAVKKEKSMDKQKQIAANGKLHIGGMVQSSGQSMEQNQTFLSLSKLPNSVKELEGGFQSISLADSGCAFSMLNRNVPIFMNCPHCSQSKTRKDLPKIKFAGTISQLQRIFLVTPSFPVVLATCPFIQFETSCLPIRISDCEQQLQFSLGCQVILPPESFLTLKLPSAYGVQLADGSLHPLNPFEEKPELTAWIVKGTTLQVVSKDSNFDEGFQT